VEGVLRISFLSVQVVFLIALQLTSFVLLWAMNPLSQSATDTFALYLSMDLVAFTILSYIYRSMRMSREPSRAWTSVGYLAIVILLVSNLTLA
jgi:predicted membrane channel-forming protein YqfA (hemolysin III family)